MADLAEKQLAPSLYESDYHAWLEAQAKALRTRDVASIDFDNLTDEVEDLGKSEKRQILSRQEVLYMHLLKWLYQPDRRSRSWRATIREQRLRLQSLIEENPSLANLPVEQHDRVYRFAVLAAVRETGRDEGDFPLIAPFSALEALDERFWPDA